MEVNKCSWIKKRMSADRISCFFSYFALLSCCCVLFSVLLPTECISSMKIEHHHISGSLLDTEGVENTNDEKYGYNNNRNVAIKNHNDGFSEQKIKIVDSKESDDSLSDEEIKQFRSSESNMERIRAFKNGATGKTLLKLLKNLAEDSSVRDVVTSFGQDFTVSMLQKSTQSERTTRALQIYNKMKETVSGFDEIISKTREAVRDVYQDRANFASPSGSEYNGRATIARNIVASLRSVYNDIENGHVVTDMNLLGRILRQDIELNEEEFKLKRTSNFNPASFVTGDIQEPIRSKHNSGFLTASSSPSVSSSLTAGSSSSFLHEALGEDEGLLDCSVDAPICDLSHQSCYIEMRPEDQGACKAGWAFAVVSVIQINQCSSVGEHPKYSTQEILDCTAGGCDGTDSPSLVLEWLVSAKHLANASDYPYTGSKGTCTAKEKTNAWSGKIDANESLTKYEMTDGEIDAFITTVKKLIVENGAVLTNIVSTGWEAAGYHPLDSCATRGSEDHAVAVIGWNKFYGSIDTWVVRNSWGDNWGINGLGYVTMKPSSCEDSSPFYTVMTVNIECYNSSPYDNSSVP